MYKYKEGDIVKLRRFRKEPGTGKYADRYEGPYFILDILGDVTFRIVKDQDSRGKVVHHDHILPYFPKNAPENVDNAWVLRKSKTYIPTNKVDVTCQASDEADAAGSSAATSHENVEPAESAAADSPRKRVKISAPTEADDICNIARKRGRPPKEPALRA